MDYDAQRVAQNELEAGERLLWAGRPDPKRSLLPGLAIFVFAIPWTAFAVFWVYGAYSMGRLMPGGIPGFGFFPLFGVPFILIGLAMLASPLWMYQRAAQTVYAITDQRILIIKGGVGRSVQSFGPRDVGNIERIERGDGSGDLYFARQSYITSQHGYNQTGTQRLGFIGVRDVRAVEHILRDTFQHD